MGRKRHLDRYLDRSLAMEVEWPHDSDALAVHDCLGNNPPWFPESRPLIRCSGDSERATSAFNPGRSIHANGLDSLHPPTLTPNP